MATQKQRNYEKAGNISAIPDPMNGLLRKALKQLNFPTIDPYLERITAIKSRSVSQIDGKNPLLIGYAFLFDKFLKSKRTRDITVSIFQDFCKEFDADNSLMVGILRYSIWLQIQENPGVPLNIEAFPEEWIDQWTPIKLYETKPTIEEENPEE
jgi:hypothetical protein